MRLEKFIEELYKAGWQATGDAQHANIKYLHRQLFPVVAELEELENIRCKYIVKQAEFINKQGRDIGKLEEQIEDLYSDSVMCG